MWRFLGIFGAVVIHVAVILFGGLLFFGDKQEKRHYQQVDLLSEEELAKKPEEQPKEPEPPKEIEADQEEPPDAAQIIRSLEVSAAADAPELEAASLSAIEAALNGQSGAGGDFAESLSFASGGRIGGMGEAGGMDEKLEGAFSMAEIDQKPRPIFQAAPSYPSEMRGKKVEGLVTLIFIVDATGKVLDPKVEKSSHTAFNRPALEAVKQWKFEPGVKAGQRVACKMRAPIRFPQS